MLAVVAIITYFVTKRRRRKPPQTEEFPLSSDVAVNINNSPLLRIPPAEIGEEPFFLCFDTETSDLLPKSTDSEAQGRTSLPSPIVLSYNLLTREGRFLLSRSEIFNYPTKISEEAYLIHGISADSLREKGKPAETIYSAFREAFARCRVVVAHNLPIHRKIIDEDLRRNGFPPMKWEEKELFCTMEAGESYLRRTDPLYIASAPSLRLLYSKLYYDRYNIRLIHDNKSVADLLLVSACLNYLYDSK